MKKSKTFEEYEIEKDDIIYYTISITAEQAHDILATKMAPNRTVSNKGVEVIAQSIRDREWKVTGQPIIIMNGKVIDGQYRLKAIARSDTKTPVEITVAEHQKNDDQIIHLIDIGTQRRSKDSLKLLGWDDKTSKRAPPVVTLLMMYLNNEQRIRSKVTNQYVMRFVEEFDGIDKAVMEFYKLKYVNTTVASMILYCLQQAKTNSNSKEFIEFIHAVENEDTSLGTPSRELGKFVHRVKHEGSTRAYRMEYWLGYYIEAWHLHLAGKRKVSFDFKKGMQIQAITGSPLVLGQGLPASLIRKTAATDLDVGQLQRTKTANAKGG
jgi:hypothetical protein